MNDNKNLLIILSVLVLVVLSWFGWRFYASKAPTQNKYDLGQASVPKKGAKLWLEPSKGQFQGQFAVDVFVQTETAIDGLDVRLFYPQDKLAVVDQDASAQGIQVQTGRFDEYPLNKVDENQGLIMLSGIVFKSETAPLNQPFLTARIFFNTIDNGQANLNFDFQPGSTLDSNVAGSKTHKDILKEVKGATFTL